MPSGVQLNALLIGFIIGFSIHHIVVHGILRRPQSWCP